MTMYASVLQICKDEHTAWENIPVFTAAVAELESELAILHQAHAEYDVAIAGVSESKNELKAELIEHIYVIAKALSLKGTMMNDKALQIRNKGSLTSWNRLPANALLHRITALQADLELHGAALAELGITSEFIAETQVLIGEVSNVLFAPRIAIIHRKEITELVRKQTRRIDQLLNEKMDILILSFKESLPSFYSSYQSARMIIDYGSHGPKGPAERDDGKVA